MIDFQPRPSMRLIQQIARVERFAGAWERLSQSSAVASPSLLDDSLSAGSAAALALDITSPAGVQLELPQNGTPGTELVLEKSKIVDGKELPLEAERPKLHFSLEALIRAHLAEAPFDPAGVEYCYELISAPPGAGLPLQPPAEGGSADPAKYRRTAGHFLSANDSVVFPTVSAFLIEQRLGELLDWTRRELALGHLHPLLLIGSFHLQFLQISPYAVASHRLSLLLTWRLLAQHGYGFVRYQHFAPQCLERSIQYFNALRQAEKTACGNWATLNIWLEFFLESLIEASEALSRLSARKAKNFRLSSVQKQILEVVRVEGAATRETIVRTTGINMSTVKYNLSVLSGRGQLKREGAGRTTSYRLI